jgi:anthranilate synthase component 1
MKKPAPILFQQEHLERQNRAMQLIEEYEKQIVILWRCHRFHGFEGNFNHAIMIRTFLSKNQLHSQAGAGIVAGSDEESEMEVYNKPCVE